MHFHLFIYLFIYLFIIFRGVIFWWPMVQYPEHPYFLLTLFSASGSIQDDKDSWSEHREEHKAKNEAEKWQKYHF